MRRTGRSAPSRSRRKRRPPRSVRSRGSTAATPNRVRVATKSQDVFCAPGSRSNRTTSPAACSPTIVRRASASSASRSRPPKRFVHGRSSSGMRASVAAHASACIVSNATSDGKPCSSTSRGASVPSPSRTTAKSSAAKFGSASRPGTFQRAGTARSIRRRRAGSHSCATISAAARSQRARNSSGTKTGVSASRKPTVPVRRSRSLAYAR